MAPGQFLLINSEMLGNHSLGIDTAFATMSDQPTHNLAILGQPNGRCKKTIRGKGFADKPNELISDDSVCRAVPGFAGVCLLPIAMKIL